MKKRLQLHYRYTITYPALIFKSSHARDNDVKSQNRLKNDKSGAISFILFAINCFMCYSIANQLNTEKIRENMDHGGIS